MVALLFACTATTGLAREWLVMPHVGLFVPVTANVDTPDLAHVEVTANCRVFLGPDNVTSALSLGVAFPF
ncbi:MAG: hypothetical protein HQ559_05215 [Lentisphaerae bacterium]|nr:hypothetical protein [Lentisphaerota bacterium]